MDIALSGDLQHNPKNRTQMTQIKRIFTDFKNKSFNPRQSVSSVSSVFRFVLIPIFILALAGSSFSQSEPPPRIIVTPTQVNLGIMKKNEVKLYKVIVRNAGKGDLYITNIPAPNEKTGVPLSKNAIKPGKKIELTFFYKAVDKGKIKDFVSIESNDPKTPSVKIILKGEVR
jgi:hypothetical protein